MSIEDLPIYEPDFKRGRTYRMSMLGVFETEFGPCGGLAVVWWDVGENLADVIVSRRPAVIRLPRIWTGPARVLWNCHFPEQIDQIWKFSDEEVMADADHPHVRAWGGYWFPAPMMWLALNKSAFYHRTSELVTDVNKRALELLRLHKDEVGFCASPWFLLIQNEVPVEVVNSIVEANKKFEKVSDEAEIIVDRWLGMVGKK